MSPASHAPLWTRQDTNAFNQPLTFDTSSVTDMQYMFQVRSAPAHTPARLLARLPPSHLCLPFGLGRTRMRSTSR